MDQQPIQRGRANGSQQPAFAFLAPSGIPPTQAFQFAVSLSHPLQVRRFLFGVFLP
jgi:hypothetical protein